MYTCIASFTATPATTPPVVANKPQNSLQTPPTPSPTPTPTPTTTPTRPPCIKERFLTFPQTGSPAGLFTLLLLFFYATQIGRLGARIVLHLPARLPSSVGRKSKRLLIFVAYLGVWYTYIHRYVCGGVCGCGCGCGWKRCAHFSHAYTCVVQEKPVFRALVWAYVRVWLFVACMCAGLDWAALNRTGLRKVHTKTAQRF